METYYGIYKITNQINGKIYIGSHKTEDLNDSYMGSGKYLIYAQTKYGIEHFTKEILYVFGTPEEMYLKEAELVNEEFISEQNTYNIKQGGFGGFDYINAKKLNLRDPDNPSKNSQHLRSKESQNRARDMLTKLRSDSEWVNHCKNKISSSMKKHFENKEGNFRNKQHTEETKLKIGLATSKAQKGKGNSQYGTCWISHELFGSKKCKTELLPEYINNGWVKGRNIFKS